VPFLGSGFVFFGGFLFLLVHLPPSSIPGASFPSDHLSFLSHSPGFEFSAFYWHPASLSF
jgi:hypothetical protein